MQRSRTASEVSTTCKIVSFLPACSRTARSTGQNLIPRSYAFVRTRTRLRARRNGLVLLLLVYAPSTHAQEFIPEQVVFPITDFKPDIRFAAISIKFGTGFCLDRDCRFVGTNYHVAKLMGKYVRIKGVFSAHRFLNSDPNDAGAQEINLGGLGGSLKFTPAHDLAIYEMRHPLKNFHGIGFEADDLQNRSEVDIYAYPFNLNPKRRLVHWHGSFRGKTREGLLAFSYEEGRVRSGASGGIVVDSKTKQIVGVLHGIAEGKDRIAYAVPVKELSDFIARAEPFLQASLFPKTVFISPVAADLYAPYVWPRTDILSERTAEPAEVINLRRTAQHLADSMRNFIATQTFAWGQDNREPEVTDAYETFILDGWQRWRHRGGKKLYDEIPFPSLGGAFVTSGAEWSVLPQMVGTEFKLKIHEAPDAVVNGRTVHVFQYAANLEDRVCGFVSVTRFGVFHGGTPKFYDCHGEVWIDESGIILRISEAIDLSGPWYHYWGVMTYGWLEKDGTEYLVPITIATQAERNKTYWCRGLFTDYKMFGVKTHLVLPTEPESAQESEFAAH